MQLPQRSSLVAQVAEILRKGIREGEWMERLPSEVALCDRLQVSRRTLRGALAALERERLFKVHYAKGRVLCASTGRGRAARGLNVVGVWHERPAPIISPGGDPFLTGLKGHLNAAGYQMIVEHMPSHGKGAQSLQRFQKHIHHYRVACWILMSAPAELQQWFMERQIPTVLAGSAHPGIHLPSFDRDFRAICRHAAQTFLRLGHRRVAFVTPRTEFAGDLAAEQGFSETFQNRANLSGRVVHHNGTVAGLCQVLDELLRSSNPPTAMIVSRSIHALTGVSHLLKTGKAIPHDISLICRDNDEFLDAITPAVARYVMNLDLYTRRLARAALQLARSGAIAPRQRLFFPEFYRGESLAPPPAT